MPHVPEHGLILTPLPNINTDTAVVTILAIFVVLAILLVVDALFDRLGQAIRYRKDR